jgi:DNA-binding Lrp family transcriptional regulator
MRRICIKCDDMDEKDSKIILEIQKDAKIRSSALSRKTGIPLSTVHSRINRLEKQGVVKFYHAIVDPEKIGRPITAFVHVIISSEKSVEEVASKLAKTDGVEEVYTISGQFDITTKVRLPSTEALGDFIFSKITGLRSWPGVVRTETMLVFKAIGENIPLTPINPKK